MLWIAGVIVLAVLLGALTERRLEARAEAAARRALIGSLFTIVPFVVFFNIARLEVTLDIGGGIVLGWLVTAITALAAWAASDRLLGLSRPATGAVICAVICVNTGYLGYPMTAALLGTESLSEAVAYDIMVTVPALLLGGFAVGAAFGTRAGEGVRERVVAFFTRNPPLYAALLALLAPDALAPDALVDASRVAVILLLPVGFWAVGIALAAEAERGRLRVPPPLSAPIALAAGLRLLAAPALLAALAAPLIDLPDPYLLLSAMPAGINALVIAHAYGLDLRITSGAIAWTTGIVVVGGLMASMLL